MYAETEFKVVDMKPEEEMPGFGDYLLLRMKGSSPFEVYNYTHDRVKKGDTLSGLLEGFEVSRLKSGRRGMRIDNRRASAVGKIVEVESWTENLQECTVRGARMRCGFRKVTAYRLLVDCKYFFVIVNRDAPGFRPKKGDRVLVGRINNIVRQRGDLFPPDGIAACKNLC